MNWNWKDNLKQKRKSRHEDERKEGCPNLKGGICKDNDNRLMHSFNYQCRLDQFIFYFLPKFLSFILITIGRSLLSSTKIEWLYGVFVYFMFFEHLYNYLSIFVSVNFVFKLLKRAFYYFIIELCMYLIVVTKFHFKKSDDLRCVTCKRG